jgi:hypothetical protein
VQIIHVFNSEKPLGLHAHADKTEIFTIIEGGGTLLACLVNSSGQPLEERKVYGVSPETVIKIPPFTAHTFYLRPGTKLVCCSSAPFDEKDFIPTPFLVCGEAITV